MSIIRFEAVPFKINTWLILRLPQSASAKLPSRGQVMVKGAINDFQFQAALEPDGTGGHWFKVDQSLQKSAKIDVGDTATLAIESTREWPEPPVPTDVGAALKAHPQVRTLWMRITPMARWEWIRWIGSTSKSETRERRIEVACSKLLAGERRPCCFNRNMCCVPRVSKNGVLLEPASISQ
jgi:hypothetical protein